MTVRVGVIGVGMIGQDHIRRLTKVLAGSSVVAVTDVDPERARKVAGRPCRWSCSRHRAGRHPRPRCGCGTGDVVGADPRGVRARLD